MSRPLLILGATGKIGRSVVAAAVEASLPVIAVARDSARLDALKSAHPKADISLIANTIVDDVAGDRLARELRRIDRPLAGVVAGICGSAARGRLLDQPSSILRNELDEVLLPHLCAARHVLPLMAEHPLAGNYVLVGGPGSAAPWAGYGPRSVAASALHMLARVLHDEARALGLRVQLLDINTPACTDENRSHACSRWPEVIEIGRRAVRLALRGESSVGSQAIVPFDPHPFPRSTLGVARTLKGRADPDLPTPTSPRAAMTPPSELGDARSLLDSLISTKRNEVSR